MKTRRSKNTSTPSSSKSYPAIAQWVSGCGWIALGVDERNKFFARALDEGGMVWESQVKRSSVDRAVKDLETAIQKWICENF